MSRVSVYYLDDEPALCELFAEYFESGDIQVKTFTQAADAIAAVADESPMVMFIDYRLSDTDGEAVASQLPDDLPKVLITGDLAVTPDYPFEYIVSKPFSFRQVEEIIRTLANRRS